MLGRGGWARARLCADSLPIGQIGHFEELALAEVVETRPRNASGLSTTSVSTAPRSMSSIGEPKNFDDLKRIPSNALGGEETRASAASVVESASTRVPKADTRNKTAAGLAPQPRARLCALNIGSNVLREGNVAPPWLLPRHTYKLCLKFQGRIHIWTWPWQPLCAAARPYA